MEYLKEKQRIELTLQFTTHDLEKDWLQKDIINKELSLIKQDSLTLSKIENGLNQGFSIGHQQNIIPLKLSGFETSKEGICSFYLYSEKILLNSEITVQFNALMNTFPKQQNKLTFINKGKKQTFVFLKNQSKHKIPI
ncbi:MAG: hypothetical protein HYU67_12230 [Flavobacteriia bacterium]|nr:hypothetical protein [Flavobacteriia bacterium]